MIEGLEIRPIQEDDSPLLSSWLQEQRTEPFFPTMGEKECGDAAKHWVKMALKSKSGLTAVYRGAPVGCAILFIQTYKRLVHQAVHILVVSQEYRRLGIGSELLEHMEALGRDAHGVELCHTEIYDDPGVEAFYAKHGYVEYARHPGWSKDDTFDPPQYRARVCMEKFI